MFGIIILLKMNQMRPFINRFVKQKQLQLSSTRHNQNMKQIKPITTKLMEHSQTFTINNSKRTMSKQLRESEIEHQNKLLLRKIQTVMNKNGHYSVTKTKSIHSKCNKSLNDILRKKQMQNIEEENNRFVLRLQTKKPTFNTLKLRKDWEDNKNVIKRMTNCEFHLTHFKTKSIRIRSLTSERLFREKFEDLKITRFKNIDGRKMVIQIEFVDKVLKITGDCRDHQELKVIEIPKEQAVLYIERQCEGKAENILEKLRYDQTTQSLYIMGQNFNQQNPEKNKINYKYKTLSTTSKNRHLQRFNRSTLQYSPQIRNNNTKNLNLTVNHRAQSNIQVVNSYRNSLEPQQSHYQSNFQSSYNKEDLENAKQHIKSMKRSIKQQSKPLEQDHSLKQAVQKTENQIINT